jgi:hypothetical protein
MRKWLMAILPLYGLMAIFAIQPYLINLSNVIAETVSP